MNDASTTSWPQRGVRAVLAGLALFWVGAITMVRSERGLPDWWLPLALLAGWLVPSPRVPTRLARGPWWPVRLSLLALFLAVGAALVFGATATPSRQWDGAAAYDAKAFWFAQALTLQQPFFADPSVFHHSPDHPVLLPLLMAASERWLGHAAGRVVLLLPWLLTIGGLAGGLRRVACGPRRLLAVVFACAFTPALLGPGGGAVDSGYADALVAMATTTLAVGLALGSPWELALGAVLAVASKPEGLVYAMLALGASVVLGQRRARWVLASAIAVAALAWSPTQQQLLHSGDRGNGTWIAAGLAVLMVGAELLDRAVAATRQPVRARLLVVLAIGAALLASWPLWRDAIPPTSAFGRYLHGGDLAQRGLPNLLAWGGALLEHGLLRGAFGATFAVAAVVAWCGRRGRADRRGAGVFLVLGLACTALPFVWSHEPDVHHHLRSSLPRLLLHWLGPAWWFVGVQLATAWPPQAGERADASTS